jgi:hypothetical protein
MLNYLQVGKIAYFISYINININININDHLFEVS